MAVVFEEVKKLDGRLLRVETDIGELKSLMKDAFYLLMKSEMNIMRLEEQMISFKDEMKEFKDEMREFKNEVRQEQKMMNKQWGELSKKFGTLVEDIFFPGANPLIKQYFNDEPYLTSIRVKKRVDDLSDEFDIIAVSKDRVYLFEIKSSPDAQAVKFFKKNKINNFRKLFPEYAKLELIPFFGALMLHDSLVKYITKLGIYAIAFREWEYLDILNFEELRREKNNS